MSNCEDMNIAELIDVLSNEDEMEWEDVQAAQSALAAKRQAEYGNIIIVDDGAYRWGIGRKELLAALENLGWDQDGNSWTEPTVEDDDDPATAYQSLCDRLSPIPGMDTANGEYPSEGEWDDYLEFRCISGREWVLGA